MKKALIAVIVLAVLLAGALLIYKKPAKESSPIPTSKQSITIEQYVKENISSLSPEKEVLGGKFYVTSIEAHGGAGTVHYEDGHIALIADFTYTIDEKGKPSVTTFTVRK